MATSPTPRPQLLVLAGLPGTGKSTIGDAAARILRCPIFGKDQLEATLWRFGIGPAANSGFAAYELLTTLAVGQLRLGQSAILDSCATLARIRDGWRDLAAQQGGNFRVVECVCSDSTIHRKCLERRRRDIPGWYEVSWAEAERVRSRYESWSEPRLILDALVPLDQNLAALRAYLDG